MRCDAIDMKTQSYPTAGSSKNGNRLLEEKTEEKLVPRKRSISRRSFLGKSLAVGAGTIGAGLLTNVRADDRHRAKCLDGGQASNQGVVWPVGILGIDLHEPCIESVLRPCRQD